VINAQVLKSANGREARFPFPICRSGSKSDRKHPAAVGRCVDRAVTRVARPNKPSLARGLARIFDAACDVTMAAAAAEAKAQYSAIVLGATGNVGGRIVQLLIKNPHQCS
jgi:hypothetical protein